IFRAMKRYGLIVADNGADMSISGTFDTRWNNDMLDPAFAALTSSDFEVIELGLRKNQGDGAASLSSPEVSPAGVAGGQASAGTMSPGGAVPTGGVTVTPSSVNSGITPTPALKGKGPRPLAIASFPLNPSTIVGGLNSLAIVTLSGPAPAAGALVTLFSSGSSAVSVQANVTVPAGQLVASVYVVTKAVPANSSAVIHA